jgi:hypothetical protein
MDCTPRFCAVFLVSLLVPLTFANKNLARTIHFTQYCYISLLRMQTPMFANIMQHFAPQFFVAPYAYYIIVHLTNFLYGKSSFKGNRRKGFLGPSKRRKEEYTLGKICQIDNCLAFYQYLFYGCAVRTSPASTSIQYFEGHLFILRTAANQILTLFRAQ